MTRKTRRIIILVLAGIITVTAGVLIFLAVREINRNPLLGTWHADDQSISMQFYEDGSSKVTYNNTKIPVVKTKHNGTLNATYAYDKISKEVSVTLAFYSKEITSHYTYDIEDNVMLLTDTSTNKTQKFILEYIPD